MRFAHSFLLAACVSAIPALASDAAGLSVSVAFSSVKAFPTDCICEAEIKDLATDRVLAAPKVVFRKGSTGRATIGDTRGSTTFEVAINEAGTSGTCTVTYSQGGKVVAAQKGSIAIQ